MKRSISTLLFFILSHSVSAQSQNEKAFSDECGQKSFAKFHKMVSKAKTKSDFEVLIKKIEPLIEKCEPSTEGDDNAIQLRTFCTTKTDLASLYERTDLWAKCERLLARDVAPGFGAAAPTCVFETGPGQGDQTTKEIRTIWKSCHEAVETKLKPKLLAKIPKQMLTKTLKLSSTCELRFSNPVLEVPESGKVEDFEVSESIEYRSATLVKSGKTIAKIENEVLDPSADECGGECGFLPDKSTYTLKGGTQGASGFNEDLHTFSIRKCEPVSSP